MEKRKMIVLVLFVAAYLIYSFTLYTSLPVKQCIVDKRAENGKLVWQKYNCNACHQLYGLGGYLGPDLTNVYSKRSEAFIKAFLKNGTTAMPNFNINDYEMDCLLKYFNTIDNSGKSDPRNFRINNDGTIE